MAGTWIDQGKLTPPFPGADDLARGFLPEKTALPPVALLVGGAGYGKSSAMLELATGVAAPLVWYALDPGDGDPATFFHHLVAGMQAHIPQFGEEITALIGGGKLDPRLLWQHFFAAVAAYNLSRPILALDDVHHLLEAGTGIAEALGGMLERLPPGLSILMASRKRLPFAVSRLRAAGKLLLLEQDRLRFAPAEEAAFLQARGVAATPAHARMEGWPLGLALLAEPGFSADALQGPSEASVMAYVAEELYAAREPQVQDFLLRLGLLEAINADFVTRVFAEPDAPLLLARLEAEHVVQRLADGQGYRLPAYLREFLRAEAPRAVGSARRLGWQRAIAEQLTAQGRLELALPHWLAAEAWDEALACARPSFSAMRFDGRQSLIAPRLEAFPPAVREREPHLQLWRGHLLARAGHHLEGVQAYERADKLFTERGDRAGRYKARVCLANVALLREEMPAFQAHLDAVAGLEDAAEAADLADLALVRALDAEQRGDMDGMRRFNEAALDVPVGEDCEVAASHVIALMNLYTYQLHHGDLERAERHSERALETAQRWHFHAYHVFSTVLKANTQLYRGDVEGAGATLGGLPPVWPELLDWHDLACAHAITSHLHQAHERWKEAEEAVQRSLAVFEEADYRIGQLMAFERTLWLALQRKQYARVEESFQRLGNLGFESVYELAPRIPAARARHLAGDARGALALLDAAIPALEAQGYKLHLTRARLYEAAARARLKDPRAHAALAAGINLLEGCDYGFLRGQDRALWDELAVLTDGPVPVKKAVTGPLILPQANERPLLDMQLFGHMEVRLGGVLIDQWPRRKAKLMLAALALAPRGVQGFDLAELLAKGDTPSPNLLSVNLHALRRLLEPTLAKGERSAYVQVTDERYMLLPDVLGPVDLRAFEASMTRADHLRDGDVPAAMAAYEEALAHYRGNLLEDPFLVAYFEAEREAYRRRAVDALAWLAARYHERYDNARAETLMRRAIALAPTDEDLYVKLIKQFLLQRRLEPIKQAYWDCRKALKAQLGIAPGPELESAYQAALTSFGAR